MMNKEQVISHTRALVKIASGYFIARGVGDGAAWEAAGGIIAGLSAMGWAHWQVGSLTAGVVNAGNAESTEERTKAARPGLEKLLFLVLVVMAGAGMGCVQVPSSRIKFGGASAYLPKDLTADSLKVTLRSGTNVMTFEATKLSTKNNVDVINASTAQLEAVMEKAAQLGEKIGAAAVKGSLP